MREIGPTLSTQLTWRRLATPIRAAVVCRAVLLAGLTGAILPLPVEAQRPRDEQFYYPGVFNWAFLDRYPEAARLFNAFDYGHAVLYERSAHDGPPTTAALERDIGTSRRISW